MLHVPSSSSSYTVLPHVTRPPTRVGASAQATRPYVYFIMEVHSASHSEIPRHSGPRRCPSAGGPHPIVGLSHVYTLTYTSRTTSRLHCVFPLTNHNSGYLCYSTSCMFRVQMVTLCQDAKAHVLHVLHLMLHVHSSCYMTCSMWSLHDTCHVVTTL
jgi:hypothetical protein